MKASAETNSCLCIEIPRFEKDIEGEDKTKATHFIIEIVFGGTLWTISRRFTEFFDLKEALKSKIENVPDCPKKTIFSVTTNSQLEKRR